MGRHRKITPIHELYIGEDFFENCIFIEVKP